MLRCVRDGLEYKKRPAINEPKFGYTRVTLPDFNVRAEIQTFFGLPSTKILTFCRFGFQLRFDWFNACERFLPNVVF